MKSIVIAIVVIAGASTLAGCGGPDRTPAAGAAQAKAEPAADPEKARLAGLWTYYNPPTPAAGQKSASIFSMDYVDTGGQMPGRVRLVFRDEASFHGSSYLVLEGGDFNCYSGCKVQVTLDDGPPRQMAARRPKTDEAIAMFIDDAFGLWRATAGAKKVSIEFPVKRGGTRSASFEFAGLDRSKLWGY
jgi:hypothetical protein